MSGENLARLKRAKVGAEPVQLTQSQTAWLDGATSLDSLRVTLTTVAIEVERGFSDGVTGDDEGTAKRARLAVEMMRDATVVPRRDQMNSAAAVLLVAAQKLRAVKKTPVLDDPGEMPKRPSSYGTVDDIDAIRADRAYDNALSAHKGDVTAFGDADEVARKQLEELDKAYADAIVVFEKIHGEPVYPEDIPPPGENGPGGFPRGPIPGPSPIGGPPIHQPPPPVHIPGPNPGDDIPPPNHPIHPINPGHPPIIGGPEGPGPEVRPDQPIGPGRPSGPGGGGGGINPIVAGGIGAGVLGGPGIVNAVRGALGGRGALGASPGAIGSSSRVGGPGALGRPGAATAGSPVSRGAGGGGGRGAGSGGGRGVGAGGAGGRGRGAGGRGAGGRGIGAAGGGARKGKRRGEEGSDRDLFDDGSDWLDDEGAGPDVLG